MGSSCESAISRLVEYAKNIPRFDNWADKSCFSFFGYGNGRALPMLQESARAGTPIAAEAPCTVCPKAFDCWGELKKKASGLMPVMVNEFEAMANHIPMPHLISVWKSEHGHPDPYFMLSAAHLREGLAHETNNPNVVVLADQRPEDYDEGV